MMGDKGKRQRILSEAIQAFAATPRYNFLRTLQVGRFLSPDEDGVGVVSELTFEKLVELGSAKIAKLRWLSEPQEGRLIALLAALSDEGLTPNPMERLITPPPRPSPLSSNYTPEEEDGLSSAEVENRLRDILGQISSHPKFLTISNKPLSFFWDENWPRAPFEEAMSLDQLCSMDLALLWKKRTTTSRRIDRMARAAQNALDSLGTVDTSPKSEVQKSQVPDLPNTQEPRRLSVVPQPHRPATRSTLEVAASRHPWMEVAEHLSPLERVGLRKFLEVCLQPDVRNDPLGSLVSTLIEIISLEDFIAVLASDWTLDSATPAVRLFAATPDVQQQSTAIRMALQGPGVHISALRNLAPVFENESEAGELALTCVVRMLGGAEVYVKGEKCPKVFSMNPGLLETALSGIADFDKKDPGKTISRYLPNLDPHLTSWLLARIVSEPQKSGRAKGKKLPPAG